MWNFMKKKTNNSLEIIENKSKVIKINTDKKLCCRIDFYDGSIKSYSSNRITDISERPEEYYAHFVLWFENALDTSVYAWRHSTGVDYFYKKDIKRVHFYIEK